MEANNKYILDSDWEDLPDHIAALLSFLVLSDESNPDFELLFNVKEAIEKWGYTYSYGIDGKPYDLRKM